MCVCLCVIVISFGWYQDEPESTCHCPWMLLMVLPMRKEEGRRWDRVQGSMPVLTCLQVSAVDSLQAVRSHTVFLLGNWLPTWLFQILMIYGHSATALWSVLIYTMYGTLYTFNLGTEKWKE